MGAPNVPGGCGLYSFASRACLWPLPVCVASGEGDHLLCNANPREGRQRGGVLHRGHIGGHSGDVERAGRAAVEVVTLSRGFS